MDNSYCVNGSWFNSYRLAVLCAAALQEETGKYYAVYTMEEMEAMYNDIKTAASKDIDHEKECGK